MASKLISYRKALAMCQKELDAALVPIRAKQARQAGEMEISKIEEQLLTLEVQVQELCSAHPLDYSLLIHHLDQGDLLERRKAQMVRIIYELFDEAEEAPAEEGK